MKTDRVTVFDLFEKQRRYLVPIFQRGYVWTKEGQWEPLWEDIVDQATIVRASSATTRQSARKHFLGAIVLNQVSTQVRHVAASEIIDGQQRLMTLQILLAALRDVVSGIIGEYPKTIANNLTSNIGVPASSEELFKVWPTYAYQDDLRKVMTAGSAKALAAQYPQYSWYRKMVPPRPPVVDAYLYFHDVISAYVNNRDDEHQEEAGEIQVKVAAEMAPKFDAIAKLPDVERAQAIVALQTELLKISNEKLASRRAEELIEAVTRWIQLVAIELEAEDDPQVIFETLNARGVPLEPSDLIRNFVFLYGMRHGESVTELYDRWWKDFDEATEATTGKFWKAKERQGRLMRSRLDLFLFHYVTRQTRREVKVGHLYQEFRDWWNKDGDKRQCAVELEAVKRSSSVFKELMLPNTGTSFGAFAERIRALDVAPVYPLILFLMEHRGEVSQEDLEGMLRDIESYLVRRFVCGLTSKNYNRVFLSLLSKLADSGPLGWIPLQRELCALTGDSSRWPDDDAFRQALVHGPLYTRTGPQRTQMLLRALERALVTSRQEQVVVCHPLPWST